MVTTYWGHALRSPQNVLFKIYIIQYYGVGVVENYIHLPNVLNEEKNNAVATQICKIKDDSPSISTLMF